MRCPWPCARDVEVCGVVGGQRSSHYHAQLLDTWFWLNPVDEHPIFSCSPVFQDDGHVKA